MCRPNENGPTSREGQPVKILKLHNNFSSSIRIHYASFDIGDACWSGFIVVISNPMLEFVNIEMNTFTKPGVTKIEDVVQLMEVPR